MSALKLLLIVTKKELRDGLRDRRSTITVVIAALLVPLLFASMFTVFAGQQRAAEEITLPVMGAEFAPAFIDWLKQQAGIEIAPAPADPEQAVRERKEDVILIIDKDYSRNMARGIPAPVRLVSEGNRFSAIPKVARAKALIETYSIQMATLRLIARGVEPSIMSPLQLEDVDVSSAQESLATLLDMLPCLLVMAALTGGMMIAIDTTAGERERGSLEPLLLCPVPRAVLVAGKWLASSVFGCGSAVFSMLVIVFSLRRVPWQDMGIRFRIPDGDLMSLLALILPLALLLSAGMMFSSTFARSYKESQGYLTLMLLFPMLTAMFSMFDPLSNRPWLGPIPIIGQFALAADVLRGKPPGAALYVLAGLSVLACTLVLLAATSRLLKREKIIFGR